MATSHKRRQKFVDRQVQGTIVLRTATYWVLCMFTLGLMLFVWQILSGPAEPFLAHLNTMWHQYGPVAIASFLLLPILIIDIVGLSNRFAGPVYRLHRSLRQLANGEPASPVNLRDNDFLNHQNESVMGYGYAVFGKVVDGMDTVDAIRQVTTGNHGMHQDVPKESVVIEKAAVVE